MTVTLQDNSMVLDTPRRRTARRATWHAGSWRPSCVLTVSGRTHAQIDDEPTEVSAKAPLGPLYEQEPYDLITLTKKYMTATFSRSSRSRARCPRIPVQTKGSTFACGTIRKSSMK